MVKILVIEDEFDVLENLTELLTIEGFDVLSTSNGHEGLALATKYLPDIILCDVLMSGLNGFEVLEALQKNSTTKNIPLAFISAQADKTNIDKGIQLGARYITKPFYVDEMLGIIQAILEGKDEQ